MSPTRSWYYLVIMLPEFLKRLIRLCKTTGGEGGRKKWYMFSGMDFCLDVRGFQSSPNIYKTPY